ncbi:hypothetical protein [Sediminispirochaeta bajacaliforniensis]|nr:hypothetical protein [Sediminispirochaeta bajacaliforniensis]
MRRTAAGPVRGEAEDGSEADFGAIPTRAASEGDAQMVWNIIASAFVFRT